MEFSFGISPVKDPVIFTSLRESPYKDHVWLLARIGLFTMMQLFEMPAFSNQTLPQVQLMKQASILVHNSSLTA